MSSNEPPPNRNPSTIPYSSQSIPVLHRRNILHQNVSKPYTYEPFDVERNSIMNPPLQQNMPLEENEMELDWSEDEDVKSILRKIQKQLFNQGKQLFNQGKQLFNQGNQLSEQGKQLEYLNGKIDFNAYQIAQTSKDLKEGIENMGKNLKQEIKSSNEKLQMNLNKVLGICYEASIISLLTNDHLKGKMDPSLATIITNASHDFSVGTILKLQGKFLEYVNVDANQIIGYEELKSILPFLQQQALTLDTQSVELNICNFPSIEKNNTKSANLINIEVSTSAEEAYHIKNITQLGNLIKKIYENEPLHPKLLEIIRKLLQQERQVMLLQKYAKMKNCELFQIYITSSIKSNVLNNLLEAAITEKEKIENESKTPEDLESGSNALSKFYILVAKGVPNLLKLYKNQRFIVIDTINEFLLPTTSKIQQNQIQKQKLKQKY